MEISDEALLKGLDEIDAGLVERACYVATDEGLDSFLLDKRPTDNEFFLELYRLGYARDDSKTLVLKSFMPAMTVKQVRVWLTKEGEEKRAELRAVGLG